MEEIVQAINNLSKPNISDWLNIILIIISIIVTAILSYILFKQNKDNNKRNEDLQKKLNEIENKRILHNTILNIYSNCLTVKDIITEFEEIEKRLNILMNFNIQQGFLNRLNQVGYCNINYLKSVHIIFRGDKKIINILKNITEKYDEFYSKLQIYFYNKFEIRYNMALDKASEVTGININRNGIILNKNSNSNPLTNNNEYIDEVNIIYNLKIREVFKDKFDNEDLNSIVKIANEILKCFSNEEFYHYFEEYLSINKMNI